MAHTAFIFTIVVAFAGVLVSSASSNNFLNIPKNLITDLTVPAENYKFKITNNNLISAEQLSQYTDGNAGYGKTFVGSEKNAKKTYMGVLNVTNPTDTEIRQDFRLSFQGPINYIDLVTLRETDYLVYISRWEIHKGTSLRPIFTVNVPPKSGVLSRFIIGSQ